MKHIWKKTGLIEQNAKIPLKNSVVFFPCISLFLKNFLFFVFFIFFVTTSASSNMLHSSIMFVYLTIVVGRFFQNWFLFVNLVGNQVSPYVFWRFFNKFTAFFYKLIRLRVFIHFIFIRLFQCECKIHFFPYVQMLKILKYNIYFI